MLEMSYNSRINVLNKIRFSSEQYNICDWLNSLQVLEEASIFDIYNVKKCKTTLTNNGYLKESNILLYIRRTNTRYIKNRKLMIDKLSSMKQGYVIIDANIGAMQWQHQCMLFMMSKVVIGVHGGGMWNAARLLAPGQTMLEILPIKGPSNSKALAIGHGARYENLTCEKCVGPTKHIGDMNIDIFLNKMEIILDRDEANKAA